ncbi:MAG TPA: 1-acyl-sn-glycerol-3-phosphate acyltransferase [Anaeromyxobacter sp.]|nr:1-acyl-sn-glycerol-3-phosphate acyltransferase [Anaeromyxobacter sp.]
MPTTPLAREARAPAIDDALWEETLVPLVERLVRAGYFSFAIEGAEHVPLDGRAVYAQNHAGWFPLDALFLGLAVRRAAGRCRTPFFATAEAALAIPGLGPLLRRAGALPAGWFRRPERLPREVRSCAIFPEGVPGNTKPFWEAYRMRPWSRGFVRVAAALGLPIVPVAVLGGEECLPVAWTVRLLEPLVGSAFGLPLAPVPLPSRWRVVFHRPVRLRGDARALLADGRRSAATARAVERTVQGTLERRGRRYPLAHVSSWVASRRGRAGEPPHAVHAP